MCFFRTVYLTSEDVVRVCVLFFADREMVNVTTKLTTANLDHVYLMRSRVQRLCSKLCEENVPTFEDLVNADHASQDTGTCTNKH